MKSRTLNTWGPPVPLKSLSPNLEDFRLVHQFRRHCSTLHTIEMDAVITSTLLLSTQTWLRLFLKSTTWTGRAMSWSMQGTVLMRPRPVTLRRQVLKLLSSLSQKNQKMCDSQKTLSKTFTMVLDTVSLFQHSLLKLQMVKNLSTSWDAQESSTTTLC